MTKRAERARPSGTEVLNVPTLNKGTAFTEEERSALGLHGLLPPHVETLDQQATRAYEAYRRKNDDLERHIYLRALQDTNEVLFYRLLLDHIEEMTPIVYTPVVALACQQFSHIYRRARGLFVSYPLRDSIPALLRNRPNPEVDVIVVTDGERILGIGDQGAGGLGIPIGKLSLQCNNIYIFPAMGLAVVAARAQRITDGMILAAARALGDQSPAIQDASASLLPRLANLRAVAAEVAIAVGLEAQRTGVAPKTSEAELRQRVVATQWMPAYPS
jgi:malic enzyme